MAGALTLARRRRFEAGGSAVSEGYEDPYVDGATDQPVTLAPPATEQGGALSSAAPMTPQAQIATINNGMSNILAPQQTNAILAGRYTDPSLLPGATNLSMLAAAGAMLKPTHSGGFSEALGNAFSAAVPVAEAERKRETDAQLRNQLYGINQQRADTYGQRGTAYAAQVAGNLAMKERSLELQQTGMDAKIADNQARREHDTGMLDARISRYQTLEQQGDRRLDQSEGVNQAKQALYAAKEAALNNPRATPASILQTAVDSLTQKINPDTGDFWTPEDALMHVRGVSQRLAQGERRLDQGDQRIAQRAQQIEKSQEAEEKRQELRRRGMEEAAVNNTMTNAARLSAMTPNLTVGKAADQVLAARTKQTQGRGGAPQGAAPAGLPMPASAADAVIGEKYETARGLARWDGKQFIPVGR